MNNIVIIPWQNITEEALIGLMEAFVLREGTDYGPHEFSLDMKVIAVRHQLQSGKAFIVWLNEQHVANIITKEELAYLNNDIKKK